MKKEVARKIYYMVTGLSSVMERFFSKEEILRNLFR